MPERAPDPLLMADTASISARSASRAGIPEDLAARGQCAAPSVESRVSPRPLSRYPVRDSAAGSVTRDKAVVAMTSRVTAAMTLPAAGTGVVAASCLKCGARPRKIQRTVCSRCARLAEDPDKARVRRRDYKRRARARRALRAREAECAARDSWETPAETFDPLDREFGFVLDVCATPANAKCSRFLTREDDGLQQPWFGPAWMNPPYSEQGRWVEKAAHECDERGVLVVALLRSATDTGYWHDHIEGRREVRNIRGRISFDGPKKGSPPFASVVVVFRPAPEGGDA